MNSFHIYSDRIVITDALGNFSTIFLTQFSGQTYFRYKINSLTQIKHPGILLGVGTDGIRYYIHNHYNIGKAAIVPEYEFSQGMTLYEYQEHCTNAPLTVIQIALNSALKEEPYHFIANNCQTMVNEACSNQRKSEDVQKWMNGLAVFGIAVGVLALLSSE